MQSEYRKNTHLWNHILLLLCYYYFLFAQAVLIYPNFNHLLRHCHTPAIGQLTFLAQGTDSLDQENSRAYDRFLDVTVDRHIKIWKN